MASKTIDVNSEAAAFKAKALAAAQVARERLARIEELRADEFDRKAPLVQEAMDALGTIQAHPAR